MSFSSDMVKIASDQISKFITLNRHQLAGQVANLDFWISEVGHALAVIDGYGKRFEQLRTAQLKYCEERGITGNAAALRRVPHEELREARRSLCDAMYHFLIRCCNEGFIERAELRAACGSLGIGIETSDLRAQA